MMIRSPFPMPFRLSTFAKRQTSSLYLQELTTLGVLRELKRGREKYYINVGLLEELKA